MAAAALLLDQWTDYEFDSPEPRTTVLMTAQVILFVGALIWVLADAALHYSPRRSAKLGFVVALGSYLGMAGPEFILHPFPGEGFLARAYFLVGMWIAGGLILAGFLSAVAGMAWWVRKRRGRGTSRDGMEDPDGTS